MNHKEDDYTRLWQRSNHLSRSFWTSYARLFGEVSSNTEEPCETSDEESLPETEVHNEEDYINPEYLEFIRVTREHQHERDRLKKLNAEKKDLETEEYYTDISELNTLVLDNQIEVPAKGLAKKLTNQTELDLIELYKSRIAYEKIRAMEMSIDENFKTKCQELSPKFWPVLPINLKPYMD